MIYGIIISLTLFTVLIVSGIAAWKKSGKIEANKDAMLAEQQKRYTRILRDQQKFQDQLNDTQKKYLTAKIATVERNNEITEYRKEVFNHIQQQHGNPFEYEEDYDKDEE